MQAVILCAGRGKRILEFTKKLPKCLIEIGGKSILRRQIDTISKYASASPIVVIGYKAEMVREHLKDASVRFIYNPRYATTNILTSLWYALGEVKEDIDLFSIPGDLIFEDKIIEELSENKSDITVAIQKRKCDEEAVKVILEKNKVLAIGKRLPKAQDAWEFIGMVKIGRRSLGDFKKTVEEIIDKGEENGYVFTALAKMIEKGGVSVGYVNVKNYLWEEIDFVEDYKNANKKFLKK